MPLMPRESAKLIAELAKDVKISKAGIEKISDVIEIGFKQEKYDIKKYKQHELHPKTMDKSAIDWIFLVDTLNFSFWAETGKKHKVLYNKKLYTGYWSLCAAVNRALEEDIPILSPSFYANVTLQKVKHIFRTETDVEMPLLEERLKVMNEAGKCLMEKFNGSFVNVLALCEHSAEKLLKLIVENFPSYRDVAKIDDHEVSFYKRAQILIGDIWACCEGEGYGRFDDIDFITVFADYRIPQVLVFFGALEYSEALLERLKNDSDIKNGDRHEVEIRGCTIQAVELICEHLKERLKTDVQESGLLINAVMVDNYLWDYRQSYAHEVEHIPFHKTRCIYY